MLDIYTAKIPSDVVMEAVYPKERQDLIESTKNPTVRRARYCVWRLFEYALKNSLGLEIKNIDVYRSESGKWLSDDFCFSLSHTDGIVAVAISDFPVGIDVEKVRDVDIDAFSKRVLTENERNALSLMASPCDNIIKLWTAKESIYKMLGTSPFVPYKIDVADYRIATFQEYLGDDKYYLTVSSAISTEARKFSVEI